MQPVIPLQPYIQQGEGSGSAFILPRQQRQSAIDVLAQDYRVKKAEEQARNKALQDELVALEGLGKGLLPEDEKRIRDEYEKHLGWIGQQGLTGAMNPANPASPNYLENKKKMNQISSLANIGKYRKELLTDLQKKALTGEYDEESLNQAREYITKTPIEEFDVNKVGQIEKRFDPNEYLQKSLQGVKLEEETKIQNVRPLLNEKGQRVLGQNIADEVTAPKAGEIEKLSITLTDDSSYNGKRYKNYLVNQFFDLPQEQQQAIQQRVVRKNASAKDNKDLLLKGIVQELAKDDLTQRFEVKRTNKIIGEDQPSKKGGLNINFGGKTLDYDINGLPRAEKINIKVKTNNGEQQRQVSTGNFYGFKPVEILNTKTDGVVDIETNEPVTLAAGNTFDLLKVGDASAMPIAAKNFTTKSGVTYKKGQVVDDKAVAGLTQDGLVEYQPMIKGQVTYKVGNYSQTKSVVIPANNISRSVLISAGSTDVEPTSESINLAIKEAREMTDNLRKRKKISAQPSQKAVSKLDKALAAFEKQVGRKPTATELKKIQEKYK